VAQVDRGDEVEALEDRVGEFLHPAWLDAPQVGVDRGDGGSPQITRLLHQVEDVVALPADSLRRGHVDLRRPGLDRQERLPGAVRRRVVDVDDHRLAIVEEDLKSPVDAFDHVTDGVALVVGRDADDDLRRLDALGIVFFEAGHIAVSSESVRQVLAHSARGS